MKWFAFPDKEKLGALFNKKNWLFFAGIAGILLIFLSDIIFKEKPAGAEKQSETVQAATDGFSEYEVQLVARLEKMLADVSGAGEVRVMLTLESTQENVYAQNEQSETQTQDTQPPQHRSTTQSQLVILDKNATGDEALLETQLYPQVQGVAVLCTGADDITVVKRITDLVSVVLGVPTNRVCVEKMT